MAGQHEFYVLTHTGAFIEVVGLFVIFHQAAIELWKLTGAKTRRYWEALAYIVYGPSLHPAGPETESEHGERAPLEQAAEAAKKAVRSAVEPLADAVSTFPSSVSEQLRKPPQERLIQSFLLRAVGDSPVTEISDMDIKNIINITRQVAPDDVRNASLLLEEYISAGSQDAEEVRAAFGRMQTEDNPKLRSLLRRWIADLEARQKVSIGLLMYWRNQFNEQFLPGIVRAEKELGNSLKAAEYEYLQLLKWVSVGLAAAEAFVVGLIAVGTPWNNGLTTATTNFVLTFLLAFGGLLLIPQGTQGLLRAVIGIGKRLAP